MTEIFVCKSHLFIETFQCFFMVNWVMGLGAGSCKSHCNLLESAGYSRVFTKHRLYRFYGHNIVTLFPE